MSLKEQWDDFLEFLGLGESDEEHDECPPDPNDPSDLANYDIEEDEQGRMIDSNGDLLFPDEEGDCDD